MSNVDSEPDGDAADPAGTTFTPLPQDAATGGQTAETPTPAEESSTDDHDAPRGILR